MKVQRGRAMRLLAGTLAGAMALSVSPLLGLNAAGAADPLPPLANPIADGAVCDDAPGTNPFDDLGAETAATREVILCLVATELTTGTSATTYTPGGTVTRRQMALFIKRLADLLDELETGTDLQALPVYDNVPDYTDVAAEDPVFQEAIGQLDQADIVGGFGDGTFKPGVAVSRRQMAAFVNRLQEFLTGSPYTTTNDYFDDDEGDSGEDDLNALASVGIFQGDGEGSVDPGDSLTRRQMANILLRDVQVLFAAGSIDTPFEAAGMATLSVAPADVETLQFAAGIDRTTAEDDRTYTASGLPASSGGYHIALVASENVFVMPDGSYRFAEEGTSGLMDSGTVAAKIVKVNGANVDPHQHAVAVQPQNGTITFTVDGNGTEAIIPVINVDKDPNPRLDVDDQGRPTEDFGVGGQLEYIPAEAASGAPVNGDVTLDGANFAVVDGTLSESTVFFRSGDTYRIGSGTSFTTATATEFHAALSTGDTLRTCSGDDGSPADYTRAQANSFCLTDSGPANPTGLTASAAQPTDKAITLAWTAAPAADWYNIYANAQSCPNTTPEELTEIARVPARDRSHTVSVLDAETTYCFVVTTTESGDQSAKAVGTGDHGDDNTAQRTTTGPVEAPTVTSAVLTNDLDTGALTEDDVITLVFSEPMDPDTVEDSTFAVTDADGDTTTIVCAATPALPLPIPQADDGRTTASCELSDGANATVADDTLTIAIVENGDDANTAGGNDAIEFPLTITASTGLTDADDGKTVDVAGSADKTIS